MEILLTIALIIMACWCLYLHGKLDRVNATQDEFLKAQNIYNEAMLKSIQECIEHSKKMDQTFNNFTHILKQMGDARRN